jgi:hypothetical protein
MAALTTEEHLHEIEHYVSVQKRIEKLCWSRNNIPVKMKTALGTTLTKLFNSPATSISVNTTGRSFYYGRTLMADISLMVDGEDAGTFGHPEVEKILGKCQPSPFGKGDKTVMDLEYRNGKEIAAKDIIIGSSTWSRAKDAFYNLIQDEVSHSLFGGKPVNLKLYKLAVYEKDGHFDWHRDTTHGDDHHATVLVALNTEWKGGNLGLRHQGTTVDVDLHPTIAEEEVEDEEDEDEDEEDEDEDDEDEDDKDDDKDGGRKGKESKSGGSADKPSTSKLNFQIIAFYTDIEQS